MRLQTASLLLLICAGVLTLRVHAQNASDPLSGIWIGDWVLTRTSPGTTRERPYLAAVIGLLILQVVGLLPILSMIASLFGYGAVLLLAWQTIRPGSQPMPQVRRTAPVPMAS